MVRTGPPSMQHPWCTQGQGSSSTSPLRRRCGEQSWESPFPHHTGQHTQHLLPSWVRIPPSAFSLILKQIWNLFLPTCLYNLLYCLLQMLPPVCQARFLSGFMQEDAPYRGRDRGDTGVHWTQGACGKHGNRPGRLWKNSSSLIYLFPKAVKKKSKNIGELPLPCWCRGE